MKRLVGQCIQDYINGWRQNDADKIIRTLTEDCVIIESHGPTYHGVEEIRQWVELWQKEKGRVTRWDTTSFYFLEKENTAFVEWDFACTVSGKDYALPGISVVKFSGEKIAYMHEYRMTKAPYDWNAAKLNPE